MIQKKKRVLLLALVAMLNALSLYQVKGSTTNILNPIYNYSLLDKSMSLCPVNMLTVSNSESAKKSSSSIEDIFFGKGIIQSDEYVPIKKDCKKQSQIVGYCKDGSVVTIEFEENGLYKVRAGSVNGYINENKVVVDTEAKHMMLNNEKVFANFKKNNVCIYEKENLKGEAIGMGYKNYSYPVVGFNKEYSKVLIKRTNQIIGWVKSKDVGIRIDKSGCITRAEYQKMKLKDEIERLNAIKYVEDSSSMVTSNSFINFIAKIIAHNESGDYSAARNGLPQFSGEKTITVGAYQWYGERAHNLLRKIYLKDTNLANETIDNCFSDKKINKRNVKKLINDIMSHTNWENTKRYFSNEEIIAIRQLLISNVGKKVQNEQIVEDIQLRIDIAKNTYKLTDKKLIAYFVDLFWQNPANARTVTKQCIKHFKGSKLFNSADENIVCFNQYALKNHTLGGFSTRRNWTYKVCNNLE